MSSGTQSQPGVIQRLLGNIAGKLGSKDSLPQSYERLARLGMTERQQRLNMLWSVFRCQQYEARTHNWDGKKVLTSLDKEAISSGSIIPPGFYDAGGQTQEVPLDLRRPMSPSALVTVIVNRFTGMLFSEQQHPEVQVEGDSVTQDFLQQVVEEGRLWSKMIQARDHGGAMGSAVLGFQWVKGKPVFEVHDPRWCTPHFEEHGSLQLLALEKKYMYTREVQDKTTRRFETKLFWYRRVIDTEEDVVFEECEVTQEEPNWVVKRQVKHQLGFCPVVWVHNLPVASEIDGDPDCDPFIYEKSENIDKLRSQASRGALANCDPTLVFTTKAEMADIKKGSGNALRIPDGDAHYLEMTGQGVKTALEIAADEKKEALEQAQCVLEGETVGTAKTATEIERRYQSMISKTDKMREQYGPQCIVPLMDMVYQASVKLATPTTQQVMDPATQRPQVDSEGNPVTVIVRGTFKLTPKKVKNPLTGGEEYQDRTPGDGGTVKLKWPGYFNPTNADIEQAARAATAAKDGGLIDDETAIRFTAPYFKAEDDHELVEKVRSQAAQKEAQMNALVMQQTAVPFGPVEVENQPRISNGADTPGLPA